MKSAAQRPLVSEEQFLRLPETTAKIELVDGEVIVSPSPTYWHQEILGRIVVALRSWAAKRKGPVTIGQAPLDVRFASGRILQPDAFVLFRRIPRSHQGPIDRIPELCVEVLSSERLHDRVTKRLLYAAAGDPVEVIAGDMPRRQRRLVEAWAELHQVELMSDWERLQRGLPPQLIEPLK